MASTTPGAARLISRLRCNDPRMPVTMMLGASSGAGAALAVGDGDASCAKAGVLMAATMAHVAPETINPQLSCQAIPSPLFFDGIALRPGPRTTHNSRCRAPPKLPASLFFKFSNRDVRRLEKARPFPACACFDALCIVG
jgi:hypothetical protein